MGDKELLRLLFDAFELDEADARLTRDGRPIALPPKAFAVLCTLARQRGQLLTNYALLDAVWGHQHVSESVLKTIISTLRAALADDPKQPRSIETAARRGYRFIGQATLAHGADARVAGSGPRASELEPLSRLRQLYSMIGRRAAVERLRGAWSTLFP